MLMKVPNCQIDRFSTLRITFQFGKLIRWDVGRDARVVHGSSKWCGFRRRMEGIDMVDPDFSFFDEDELEASRI